MVDSCCQGWEISFYEILTRETREYEPISEEYYKKPRMLKPVYFDKVLLKDYRPIFAFDVAVNLKGMRFGDASKKIILAVKALFPWALSLMNPDFRLLFFLPNLLSILLFFPLLFLLLFSCHAKTPGSLCYQGVLHSDRLFQSAKADSCDLCYALRKGGSCRGNPNGE